MITIYFPRWWSREVCVSWLHDRYMDLYGVYDNVYTNDDARWVNWFPA